MKKKILSQPKTLGEWSYLAIEKHFHKIIKQENDLLKDGDPEHLHQMRVGIRRLRSAMTGFAPALELPKPIQEKKISKIAHKLGELRDLDVLKEALQKYQSTLDKPESKNLEKVIENLTKQRKQAFSQIKSTLASGSYQKFKSGWEDWLKQPTYQPLSHLPIQEVIPDLLLPMVSELFLHSAWLIGSIETLHLNSQPAVEIDVPKELNNNLVERILETQGATLHSLRKQTKRVRYQMELFAEFYGSNYAAYLQDLKEIQKILGQIQDSVVLAEYLADNLKLSVSDSLPNLSNQLIEYRYQAWQEWQPLHQKYLNPTKRKDLYLILLKPSSEPISSPAE